VTLSKYIEIGNGVLKHLCYKQLISLHFSIVTSLAIICIKKVLLIIPSDFKIYRYLQCKPRQPAFCWSTDCSIPPTSIYLGLYTFQHCFIENLNKRSREGLNNNIKINAWYNRSFLNSFDSRLQNLKLLFI
jgi:hypothetical protein